MPFLVFFSHLSSLLSSSLKRLGSSSFSRISSHCLWYCPRGFSGKEVWSAFTPPSSAPPWQGENTGDTTESPGPHTEAHAGDHGPQAVRPPPTPPSRPSEPRGSLTQLSGVLFPTSQWHAPLWGATLSQVEPWASQVCWGEKGGRPTTLHQWVKQCRLFPWQFFSLLLNGSLWINFQEWTGLKYGHFYNSRYVINYLF